MTKRDRAAIDVDSRRVDAELANDRQRLRRERLVQLEQMNVGYRQLRSFERALYRRRRSHAHHHGIDTNRGVPENDGERSFAERSGTLDR